MALAAGACSGVMVATNTTPLVRKGTQERAIDDGLEQHKGPVEGTSGPLTPLVGRRLLSGFVRNPAVTQQDAGFTHTACPESSGRIEAPLGVGQCRGEVASGDLLSRRYPDRFLA